MTPPHPSQKKRKIHHICLPCLRCALWISLRSGLSSAAVAVLLSVILRYWPICVHKEVAQSHQYVDKGIFSQQWTPTVLLSFYTWSFVLRINLFPPAGFHENPPFFSERRHTYAMEKMFSPLLRDVPLGWQESNSRSGLCGLIFCKPQAVKRLSSSNEASTVHSAVIYRLSLFSSELNVAFHLVCALYEDPHFMDFDFPFMAYMKTRTKLIEFK